MVFDLGGVLVRVHLDWGVALRRAGFPSLAEEFLGTSVEACPGFHEHEVGELGDEEYLARLAAFLGLQPVEALAVHQGILGEELPGVASLLRDLKRGGTPTACLSNTNALHWMLLGDDSPYPSVRLLDRRFGSHEIGARKPSAEAYAAVEAAFPGHRIAFFDDSPVNVRAALQRGWQAWEVHPDSAEEAIRRTLEEIGVLERAR
ncbi:MAG: hypothetical protein N2109_05150 [Fimbriimonadales bacterium]|nr:hypothetical protein [Fimbriimonadales bacterium]